MGCFSGYEASLSGKSSRTFKIKLNPSHPQVFFFFNLNYKYISEEFSFTATATEKRGIKIHSGRYRNMNQQIKMYAIVKRGKKSNLSPGLFIKILKTFFFFFLTIYVKNATKVKSINVSADIVVPPKKKILENTKNILFYDYIVPKFSF